MATVNGINDIGQGLTELQLTGSKLPNKIFVGGLAEQTKESHIREAFLEIDPSCPVLTVKIIVDRSVMTKSNEPRRYAFVEFGSEAEVKKILDLITTQNKTLDLHGRRLTVGQAYRKANTQPSPYAIPGLAAMYDPLTYLRYANMMTKAYSTQLMSPIGVGCYPYIPAPVDYSAMMPAPYMMAPYSPSMAPSSPQVVPSTPVNSPFAMKSMNPMHGGTLDNGYMVPMSNGNGSCGSMEDAVPDSYPYKYAAMPNGNVNGDGRRGRVINVPHTVPVQQPAAGQMNPRYVNQSPASGPMSGDTRHYVPTATMHRQYGQ